ncbi:MAG: hypothetical protein U1E22_06265, partial [Coriobacteriia bacterium]|nr:hypothetical protein [Coriobacteriia bacterium]
MTGDASAQLRVMSHLVPNTLAGAEEGLEQSSKYDALVASATLMLCDQAGQALNLAVALSRELSAEPEREEPALISLLVGSDINLVTVRALKTAILALLTGLLETVVNLIASLAVQVSEGGTVSLVPAQRLSQVELDFLFGQETVLDLQTAETEVRTPRFAALANKLTVAPVLLARVQGVGFRLDKSTAGWRRFQKFKALRNSLTHPRVVADGHADSWWEYHLDDTRMSPGVRVSTVDLVDAAASIVWYLDEVSHLLIEDSGELAHNRCHIAQLLRLPLGLIMVNLREHTALSAAEFESRYCVDRL